MGEGAAGSRGGGRSEYHLHTCSLYLFLCIFVFLWLRLSVSVSVSVPVPVPVSVSVCLSVYLCVRIEIFNFCSGSAVHPSFLLHLNSSLLSPFFLHHYPMSGAAQWRDSLRHHDRVRQLRHRPHWP